MMNWEPLLFRVFRLGKLLVESRRGNSNPWPAHYELGRVRCWSFLIGQKPSIYARSFDNLFPVVGRRFTRVVVKLSSRVLPQPPHLTAGK